MTDKVSLLTLFNQNCDRILEYWLQGMSLRQAAEYLFLPGHNVYPYLTVNEPNRSKYLAAKRLKALQQIDKANELAEFAAQKGQDMIDPTLINMAINHFVKSSAKLAPEDWGDKSQLELSGNVKVEQNLSITPADAYERMLKGGV